MKKAWILLVVGLLLMSGCTVQKRDDVQNKEGLTIGLLATLTGPAAMHGTHVVMGAEKAVAELNARGANIELLVEDNKNNPKEALTAYHAMMAQENKPDIIFTTMSGASAAIIPLAQEAGIPVVTSLTYADFQKYDNVYQYFQTTEDLAQLATDFFKEENIGKVGLLYANIEAGKALMDVAQPKFEAEGIQIVGEEYYEMSDPDRRTQVLKLVDKQPDAIYVFDLRPDQVVDQIKEQFEGVIVFTDTPVATNLHKTYPGLEGVYTAAQLYMIDGTEQNKKFVKLFPGKDPNAEAGMGYDVINLIWQAHEIGVLPGAVTDLGEFNGLTGLIDLTTSRKPSITVKMAKIENKQLVLV